MLLACLTLALRTVAQVPEKAAPDDLVVTAEIVGYAPNALPHLREAQQRIILYAKMTIRNTSDHVRDIFMMSCDWPSSWIAKGSKGLFTPTLQPSCDKNAPTVVSIPVGEAAVFECPLLLMNGRNANVQERDSTYSFQLGFVEFAPGFQDFGYTRTMLEFEDDGRSAKKLKNRRARNKEMPPKVYWSNFISSKINQLTAKEITGDRRYFSYYLTHNGK